MPPEPLPWERFKERRYDRPPPDDAWPGPRWRDQLPPHNGFRGRPIGNGRPGPWRYHSAESGRGCAPFRVDDKFIGDEGFRLSGYRMDGRYNRFNRDNKGSFGHRDMGGHSWENGMSPNCSGRPHFGNDLRSIDERDSFGRKDLKARWENGRLQNGIDQRSLDEKGSFIRRDMRGKPWENGVFRDGSGRAHCGNDLCSVEEMAHYEKKNLKRRSPENGVFPNGPDRPRDLNDKRSLDDKGSLGQYDLRGKSCDDGVFPSSCTRLHTGSDRSSMDEKDVKGHHVENDVVPNRSDRLDCGRYQSPVDTPTFTSPADSDVARTQVEHSKDQYDKSSVANDVVSSCKFEKENSLGSMDWKPLKWTRSGSLSSRSQKIEMSPLNVTPLRSPSGEAVACPTVSAVSSEEAGSRKKPRLGWGEGLAKFEKKKVEGPDDDSATKPGLVVCVSGESSHVCSLADKSPRVAGFLECASPATPSSVACSSSLGVEVLEEKVCVRSENVDYDTCYSSGSPILLLQEGTKGKVMESCLENVDLTSVASRSSSLTEFQPEDPATMEFNFVRSTAMNKLLVWRGETLKALEVTESEIESLENGLKKLISDSGSICPRPEISSSLHGDFQAKPSEDVAPIAISRPAPLQVISLGGVEKTSGVLGEELDEARNEDPVTPLSEFLEPLSEVKDAFSFDSVQNDKSCDTIEVNAREKLKESPMYGSTSYDGNIEDLSSSKGAGNLIAALSIVSEETLCDQILASNKDTATKASIVFNKLLPSNDCSIHASKRFSISSRNDDPQIMVKFAFKKRCRRFQEKVNTLKYGALQLLWKENLQLISLKNNHPKSQKRLELNSRGPHGGNQKHHSSFRPRFSNPAGNLSLIPTTEVINFTSKLLSESHVKPCRNSLKMPALIRDKENRIRSRFISNNGLVEDPCAVEKERSMINPWTEEEKEIFMDKLVTFGKDFNKISSFLDHKTTADCVEFYYKNHKSDWFVRSKKKPDFAKQGKSNSYNNYLVGSGKKWSHEANAASLDVLGEASTIAAKADHDMKTHQETSGSTAAQINGHFERSHDLNVSFHERETEAADVLVGICGSISSEAMSSCITSSFNRGESNKDLTNQMVGSDDGSCSDDSCGELESTDWTDEEKSILIQAFTSYGYDFAMMSRHVGTKSRDQCKVFFSKVRNCLGLDAFCPRPCIEGEDDKNGEGSDNGACVVEPDSVVSSEKSSFEGDKDVLLSHVDMNDLEKCDCKNPTKSQKMMIDELREDSKLAVNPEGEVKIESGVDNGPTMVLNLTSTVLNPDIEEDRANGEALSSVGSVSVDVGNDHGFSVFCADVGTVEPDLVSGEPRAEQEMVPDTILDDSSKDKLKATGNGLRDLNCIDQDLHASCNALNVAAGSSDACMDVGVNIKQDQKINLDLNPPLKLLDISLGEGSCPVSENSVSEGIAPRAQDGFEEIAEKLYKKSSSMDTCTQQQTSSPVFAGFPLQVAVQREMNGDCLSDMYPSQEGFLRRCSGSDTLSSVVDFSFQSLEQKKSHSRHDSWSSSDSKKARSNGDVKLFGQILKSQPNGSINSVPEKINQKLSGTNDVDLNSVVEKFDRNNYLSLENVPTRRFGFWDGNRVPVGFPSIPDSAMLLAKYPAAFSNLSKPSDIEQQQVLQSVVKSSNNDRSLNGASVFPSREMTTFNEVDYQLYRNRRGLISEMQKQNGIGAFSSLQNPMGLVGTNVGISDPVAAIKMHYAKVEQYGREPTTNNVVIKQESLER